MSGRGKEKNVKGKENFRVRCESLGSSLSKRKRKKK